MSIQDRPLIILQVEDTPSDAALTAHALKASDVPHLIYLVSHAKQALAFLTRGEGFSTVPRPDLVLLDFSLPGYDGHAILKFIKHDDRFKAIPVVVFTTSDTKESQSRAYEHYANSYVVKPLDLCNFTEKIQAVAFYWFHTSSLVSGARVA